MMEAEVERHTGNLDGRDCEVSGTEIWPSAADDGGRRHSLNRGETTIQEATCVPQQ